MFEKQKPNVLRIVLLSESLQMYYSSGKTISIFDYGLERLRNIES